MPATLLHVDSRKRVTLPLEAHVNVGEDLELEVLEDGRIVLTPIVRVPRHQLWLVSPQVNQLLKEAAGDDSPLMDMSEPGAVANLRAKMKAKRTPVSN